MLPKRLIRKPGSNWTSKSALTSSSNTTGATTCRWERVPNLHGVAHVIVENQIALGDPPAVREALARLMVEGLDRHDVVREKGKDTGA
jgi:hypothetical protein